MPIPRGKLFTLALQRISGVLYSPLLSNSDHLTVAPFPADMHDDTTYTQIVLSDHAINVSRTIYTVPAGKTFYWHNVMMASFFQGAGVDPYCSVEVVDASNVFQYDFRFYALANSSMLTHNTFDTPIAIPTGYKIRHITKYAVLELYTTIYGYVK